MLGGGSPLESGGGRIHHSTLAHTLAPWLKNARSDLNSTRADRQLAGRRRRRLLEPLADDPDAYGLGDLLDSSVTLERWIESRGGAAEPILTTVNDEEVCATTPSSALEPHAAE